jgi:putative flippase GtrA
MMIEQTIRIFSKPKSGMGKFIGFMAVGLPAFALALPLNWFLVEFCAFPKPLAYALVLIVQVTANFFMCRWLVFSAGNHKSPGRQFAEFFSGIMGFRIGDWALYTVLVFFWPGSYLAVQIFNVLVFSLLKYRFSRSVIEGR